MHVLPPDADVEYEFGGPPGVLMSIILMPLTVFMVNAACSKVNTLYLAESLIL